jgi:diguanylate cyclase (GGDEF)-like protein
VLNRFRTVSFDRITPELKTYRLWITRRVTLVILILLGGWTLLEVILWTRTPSYESSFVANLGFIGFLAASTWFSQRISSGGNTILAGYISAGTFYALALANMILYPRNIFVFSAMFFVPIMIASFTIGGRSPFVFSILASLGLLGGWGATRLSHADLGLTYDNWALFLGSQFGLHQGLAALLYSQGRHLEISFDRLHSKTEQFSQLAHTDPLTNLANRRFLIDQLQREFTRAKRYRRPLSLLYMDLDGFKSINDRFGHIFGDDMLRSAALSMRAVLRSTDLLARIGGDEFAVLLPETSIKDALGVAQKLRRALEASALNLGENIPALTFSAGVSQLRFEDENIDDLLARADRVQYLAKSEGQGQIRSQQDISQLPLFSVGADQHEDQ